MSKLNNLLGFDDFDNNWNSKQQKATKRTEVGLDILNERREYPSRLSMLADIEEYLHAIASDHEIERIYDMIKTFDGGGAEPPASPVAGRYYSTSMPKGYREREIEESKKYNRNFKNKY